VLFAVTIAFATGLQRPAGERPTWRQVAWLVLLVIAVCVVAFFCKGG
jgi:hypothetical protein